MATWWWVILWLLLVPAGLAVLGLVLRSLWRQAAALLHEVGAASDLLGQALAGAGASPEPAEPFELAVFTDPALLRRPAPRTGPGTVRAGRGRHRAG